MKGCVCVELEKFLKGKMNDGTEFRGTIKFSKVDKALK